MSSAWTIHDIIMYVDDTSLHGNIEDYSSHSFESDTNGNLEILNNWFKLNKLSLMNADKTKLMIFRKKKHITPISIYFNEVQIKETDVFKFLGIVFNNKLTWKNHVSIIAGKISKNTYKSSIYIYM